MLEQESAKENLEDCGASLSSCLFAFFYLPLMFIFVFMKMI
jgi:hypothetical protein